MSNTYTKTSCSHRNEIVGGIYIRRSTLQDALVRHLERTHARAHFNKRFVSYTQHYDADAVSQSSEPITLHFHDGSTETCDILIGADGIHSVVRGQMMKEYAADLRASNAKDKEEQIQKYMDSIDPVWTGNVIYRAVLSREKLERISPNHSSLNSEASTIVRAFISAM